MLNSVICKVTGHRVNRRRVWHDAVDFRTTCDRCNTPLIRDDREGWRPFDSDRDLLAERKAHPHSA
jgi:hypothetical protein